jgi:hypothetical protein
MVKSEAGKQTISVLFLSQQVSGVMKSKEILLICFPSFSLQYLSSERPNASGFIPFLLVFSAFSRRAKIHYWSHFCLTMMRTTFIGSKLEI